MYLDQGAIRNGNTISRKLSLNVSSERTLQERQKKNSIRSIFIVYDYKNCQFKKKLYCLSGRGSTRVKWMWEDG